MDHLSKKVMDPARQEKLFVERQSSFGMIKQIEAFLKKYGYRNGRGWWVEIER